ncbi:MAG: hypothetical protein HN509_14970 [Halobacteriovoraceae bacterium]|nr:hypothetical protein [Halobacteriovoraceae bacterium]MBT5094806.1 hypothetical protein [Halobacteriovoraceae bacterium]
MKTILLISLLILFTSCEEKTTIIENTETVEESISQAQTLEGKSDLELKQLSEQLLESILEVAPCTESNSICLDQLRVQRIELKRHANALQILEGRKVYPLYSKKALQKNAELSELVNALYNDYLSSNDSHTTEMEEVIAELFDDLFDYDERPCDLNIWECQLLIEREYESVDRRFSDLETFPEGVELARVVSNPGDIDQNCPKVFPVATVSSKSSNLRAVSNGGSKDPGYIYSLKNYPAPAKGCIPVEKVSLQAARKAMKLQNLTTEGATEAEERTLGAGLIRIQQLNGGPLETGIWKGARPYPFRYKLGKGYSGQREDHILIRRNGTKHYGLSVAQAVHEYAHLIGNQGAYGKFRSFMGSVGLCLVSNYADDNASEQFAEVFTAFVTQPSILLSNGRSPKAYEFFKQWFGKGERVKECL